MKRFGFFFVLILVMLMSPAAFASDENQEDNVIYLYLDSCPVCSEASPFVDELERNENVAVFKYEGTRQEEEFASYFQEYDIQQVVVPTFIVNDEVIQGYNAIIENDVLTKLSNNINNEDTPEMNNFLISERNALVSTIVIGSLDGFNPCSIWALLFLMSMIIRLQSRKKMAIVGITFIITVASIYGLFMVGVFSVMNQILDIFIVRFLLFSIIFLFAAINVKEALSGREKMTFVISDKGKTGFANRIRSLLLKKEGTIALFFAAVMVALFASLIELPCTAGFPIVWNGMMQDLGVSGISYLFLLLIYLFMYILTEIVIFVFILITMKRMDFSMRVAKKLKLVSGCILIFLSVLMLLGPTAINNITLVVAGTILALILGLLTDYLHRK
ncbi:thioredoxin family protein [Salipaludibacillus sp. HK11]|uniref:thioredoxin family protein n=1 Tax=Salipaludibacillus sp. HK11 TaxID=3394320 RepID=UPI0039FD9326